MIKMVKARIIVTDQSNPALESIGYESRRLPEVVGQDGIDVYEYDTPEKPYPTWIRGYSILFENDWCMQGSTSHIQTFNESTGEWE